MFIELIGRGRILILHVKHTFPYATVPYVNKMFVSFEIGREISITFATVCCMYDRCLNLVYKQIKQNSRIRTQLRTTRDVTIYK